MVGRLLFGQPYQEILRLRHITEILLRNGLGFLVEQLGLSRFILPWRSSQDAVVEAMTIPQRVRRTIEELGPTFIKLGQILSTRPDLLPPEYIQELAKLLDAAPPVPTEQIIAAIESELRSPMDEIFTRFEGDPIAAASIGQAHRAQLKDGREVIVKAIRPGIRQVVEADLDLLMRQVRFLSNRSAMVREYNLVGLVEEFGQTLREEMDYTNEARNAERLRANLSGDERVIVPAVVWEYTTRDIITMEYLEGVKLTDPARLAELGYDLHAIAETVVEIYLKQVFVDGFFHADPHPANIMVCGDRIGFVDFGMMGHLTADTKESLGNLFLGLLEQNPDRVVRTVLRLGATQPTDLSSLRRDVQRLLFRYYGVPLEEMPIGRFLEDVLTVAFRNRVHLPSDLALLARMVLVLEGLALSLDPGFILVKQAEPFVTEFMAQRLSLRRAGTRALQTLQELDELVQVLPQRIEILSEQLEQGNMTLGVDMRRLEELLARLDTIANRLSFSIIVAALIVGSSLILLGGAQAAVWRLPLLGWPLPIAQISFIVAGILALWLLWSIFRRRGL